MVLKKQHIPECDCRRETVCVFSNSHGLFLAVNHILSLVQIVYGTLLQQDSQSKGASLSEPPPKMWFEEQAIIRVVFLRSGLVGSARLSGLVDQVGLVAEPGRRSSV